MPHVFPTLASGACFIGTDISAQPLAKYPMHQALEYSTRIIRFLNDEEQSWGVRKPLVLLTLNYSRVHGYDVARIVEFFNIFLGRYTDPDFLFTFTITVNSSVLNYCVFDQDEIMVTESPNSPNYFDFTLKIRQVRI